MTILAKRKTRLVFETSDTYRGRAIMVEVYPFTTKVRLKGKRTRYELSWAGIFVQAAKVHAERIRAERKARRKERFR